ncbi:MAG: pirin family protein [Alphaproteobacteria bacterium]|nr:pirin family protein [Alphaproteobacteria bacterium]
MSLIELTIEPREKDLGGFSVRRILPFAKRRMVGPFIFLDHMGPAQFTAGHGLDVRPHPHIGLSTVTYLFEGEIQHRDTLGSNLAISPGAVNWMTAGRGIVHSERTDVAQRAGASRLHGLQSWVALPKEFEEIAPEFHHHGAATLPEFSLGGAQLKLICGRAFGHEAPVKVYSPIFYVDVQMPAGSSMALPPEYRERALYLVSGKLRIGSNIISPLTLPVFEAGGDIRIEALEEARFVLLGGEPFAEPRFIWWNFVSTSEDRIAQAKEDWQQGRFGTVPGDDKEFIPLPAA